MKANVLLQFSSPSVMREVYGLVKSKDHPVKVDENGLMALEHITTESEAAALLREAGHPERARILVPRPEDVREV